MSTVLERTPSEYWELVHTFPLVPVHDEDHLSEALAVAERLFAKGDAISEAEEAYLDVLSGLIERYEEQHYPFPEVGGKRMLRHLMEARGVRPVDLAPVLGGRQVVSDILNRPNRSLSLANIRALAAFFHVPADVFIKPDTEAE